MKNIKWHYISLFVHEPSQRKEFHLLNIYNWLYNLFDIHNKWADDSHD